MSPRASNVPAKAVEICSRRDMYKYKYHEDCLDIVGDLCLEHVSTLPFTPDGNCQETCCAFVPRTLNRCTAVYLCVHEAGDI